MPALIHVLSQTTCNCVHDANSKLVCTSVPNTAEHQLETVSQEATTKKLSPFIHSRYFYSASSSPLLLGGAPNYCVRVNMSKCYKQWGEQGATWHLGWDSNLWPSRDKAPNLPLSHYIPCFVCYFKVIRAQQRLWTELVSLVHNTAQQSTKQFCPSLTGIKQLVVVGFSAKPKMFIL